MASAKLLAAQGAAGQATSRAEAAEEGLRGLRSEVLLLQQRAASEAASFQQRASAAEVGMQAVESARRILQDRLASAEAALAASQQECAAHAARRAKLEVTVPGLHSRLQSLQGEVASARADVDRLRARLAASEQEVAAVRSDAEGVRRQLGREARERMDSEHRASAEAERANRESSERARLSERLQADGRLLTMYRTIHSDTPSPVRVSPDESHRRAAMAALGIGNAASPAPFVPSPASRLAGGSLGGSLSSSPYPYASVYPQQRLSTLIQRLSDL